MAVNGSVEAPAPPRVLLDRARGLPPLLRPLPRSIFSGLYGGRMVALKTAASFYLAAVWWYQSRHHGALYAGCMAALKTSALLSWWPYGGTKDDIGTLAHLLRLALIRLIRGLGRVGLPGLRHRLRPRHA